MMRLRHILLGMPLLLALEGPILAAPEAPPVVVSVPVKPLAASDPRAVSAAERLITSSGVGDQLDTMIPQMVDAIMPILVRGNSGQEQIVKSILREEFVSIFKALKPDFIAQARNTYLDHFSADELEEIAAFMETAVGRKMARQQPEITREMFSWGQNVGRAAVAGAMPRIIARMRAANLAVPSGT